MNIQNYINIIKEAPIPCCYVKAMYLDSNIEDIIIIDSNTEFEVQSKLSKKNILDKSIIGLLDIDLNKSSLNDIFNECIEKKEYIIEQFINKLNNHYKLHIKNIDDEYFFIWFIIQDKVAQGLKNSIKNSDEMMWIRHKDGLYISTSEEYNKVMKVENPIGKSMKDIMNPEVVNHIEEMENEIINGNKKNIVKYTVENGIWYKSKIIPLADDDDNIIGTLGIAKDISKYKDTEYETECQKKVLEQILSNMSDIFYYKNLNGEYKIWNKKFEENNNKTFEELKNNKVTNISKSKSFIKTIENSDKKVIETKQTQTIETVLEVDGCEKKLFELVKSPVFDNDKKLVGIVCIGRNISERKIKEEKSKIQKQNINELEQNINDVLIVCENSTIIYISEQCEELLGVSAEDIYNDNYNFNKYIHKEDIHLIEGKHDINGIDTIFRTKKNGETKWLWIRTTNVIYEGEDIYKRIGVISDITIHKKNEIEFEKMRMQFFANLSHEFRTPLNLIFGSIQLLKSRDEFNLELKEKYLDIIKQNGYRLLKLVDNLIDSTKIGSGCFQYNPQNYNIVFYIENICQSVVGFANQNSIDLIFDTNKEEHIVSFDVYQMERIILNLLSNAIKFNDKQQGKIEVNLNINEENITIIIKDNGIGISCDDLNDIFKMFKQVNNRFTKMSEGSGIGLSLVKSLIDMHGGTISVESELGKGTQFTIILKNELHENVVEEHIEDNYFNPGEIERIKVEFSDIYV